MHWPNLQFKMFVNWAKKSIYKAQCCVPSHKSRIVAAKSLCPAANCQSICSLPTTAPLQFSWMANWPTGGQISRVTWRGGWKWQCSLYLELISFSENQPMCSAKDSIATPYSLEYVDVIVHSKKSPLNSLCWSENSLKFVTMA